MQRISGGREVMTQLGHCFTIMVAHAPKTTYN